MEHGPSTDWGDDRAARYKTRLGLWMFALYCIVYAGFIVVNSVWPNLMAKSVAGLNWAVVYGFGLIAFALLVAIVYNALCSKAEERFNTAFADDEQEEF
jgi:uncharacterized membrane protein (DUF485 family)